MESNRPLTLQDIAPRDDDGLDDLTVDIAAEAPLQSVRRAKRVTVAKRTAPLDVGALTIEDVPVPFTRTKGAGFPSPWPPLLSRLAVGQSVFVAGRTANKLGYVRKIGKKLGIAIAVVDDQSDGVDGVRIGRIPDARDDGLGGDA